MDVSEGAADVKEGGRQADRLDLAGRLALRPREAAQALGIGERTLRALLPKLPCVREGGVVLLPVEQLREWLRNRARAEGAAVDGAVEEILDSIHSK